MTGCQTEFSLSVAVCAWCKPRDRGGSLGAISHGICLRHLRKLKLEVLGLLPAGPRRPSRRHRDNPDREGQLLL